MEAGSRGGDGEQRSRTAVRVARAQRGALTSSDHFPVLSGACTLILWRGGELTMEGVIRWERCLYS